MKYILISILILSLTGCTKTDQTNEKQQLTNQIRSKVAVQLNKEKGLIPFGSGGQMMYQIKMLALAFHYYKPINIEEGRDLLITAIDKFISEINSEERIHPYLDNYPFESKNIQIEIYLRNTDGSTITPGMLCIAIASEGILRYEIRDPFTDRLTTIYEETYEDAVKRLNKSRKSSITSHQEDSKIPALKDA